ncbi:hypothetical protein [Amycolatopsis albispora]|uniref:DUF2017 domain-containing protein n=1 Tax=Amycolatopsis albispora TaxID=1804986 RepID=A0A344LEV2_9PSEU|nr:hypothetical protein [Amycolatopsis albispora]AXB46576.1 hypothetical protein A4R43_32415 [Amycolatopsis albispora]
MTAETDGNPFDGGVSWDRRGEHWVGVFHPGYLSLFREHVGTVRALIRRRLDQHAAGLPDPEPDPRVAAILRLRGSAGLSELELLFPVVNRLAEVEAAVPDSGGVVELRGWEDRYRWGSAALDVCIALTEWVQCWSRGEEVDGARCPDPAALVLLSRLGEWLNEHVVVPLRPLVDPAPDR